MTLRPEQTLAVVVAIEEYDAGEGWRLDGPVPDACAFADWLVSRGVPPANITLLASPLDRNQYLVDQLKADGVQVADARAENIRERLVTRLPTETSELLVIHWGGHGVVDDGGDRRLLYADSRAHDRRNLNFSRLVRALRTLTYRSHPVQQLVVDSCLTFAHSMGWKTGLPDELFPPAAPAQRDQRALFAASDGERALNSDARKTGFFSEAVLESLRRQADDEWPPDLDLVWEDTDAVFDHLREQRKTRQTPSHIWYKAGSDEQERLVFTTDVRARQVSAVALGLPLLTSKEFADLRKILRAAAPAGNLRALYREAARSVDLPPPANPDDVRSVVDTLRKPVSAWPLFEFLVRLAVGTQDPVTRERLWTWIREVGPRYPVDMDELHALDGQLRRTFLLVRLQPDLIDLGHQVTVWRYIGNDGRQLTTSSEPWNFEQIAEMLTGQFVDHAHDPPPVVEFLVPTGLVDEAFERLPVRLDSSEIELGVVCPVVVRLAERLDDPDWRAAHAVAWRGVAEHHSYNRSAIYWVDHVPSDLSRLGGHACVALAYPCQGAREPEVMHELFAAGTPIALWHRPGRATGRGYLDSVLDGQAIAELPDVVHAQRDHARSASAPPDHPGHDLVLLWDDPTRVPDDQNWQLPAVVEGAVP
ncbi:caspase family protein [Saccharothrix sp. AJ9571]|nr:caspase family protein [Saccharothrix sp. AJ9571]